MSKTIKDLKDLSVVRGCACYRHSGLTDLKRTRDVFSVARTMARDRPSLYGEVPFFFRSAGACPPRSSSVGETSRSRCLRGRRDLPVSTIGTRMSLLPRYRDKDVPPTGESKSTKRFIKPQQFFSDAAPIIISFHARAALFAESAPKRCIGEQPKHRFCKRFRFIGNENFPPRYPGLTPPRRRWLKRQPCPSPMPQGFSGACRFRCATARQTQSPVQNTV